MNSFIEELHEIVNLPGESMSIEEIRNTRRNKTI